VLKNAGARGDGSRELCKGKAGTMMGLRDLARKLSTAIRVLREDGVAATVAMIHQRIELQMKLFSARRVKSIAMDGCTFSLKHIPNTEMKLALLTGEYESFERRAVLQYVDPGQPVIELGGCIGVVACITNRAMKSPRLHLVVEPNPNVISILKGNRDRNHCEFEIMNAAIAYGQDSVTFSPAEDWWGNALRQENGRTTVTVRATRLADIVNERGFNSFTLICDIEGHEYDMLLNEAEVLKEADTLIIETHARLIGERKTTQMMHRLEDLGFRLVDQEGFVVVMKRSSTC
jgi:FkbM family methyltransferase